MARVTIDEALAEWRSKDRRGFGCRQAANWFCKRVAGFKPIWFDRGAGTTSWQHCMITDGYVIIDPSPWNDAPLAGSLLTTRWEEEDDR